MSFTDPMFFILVSLALVIYYALNKRVYLQNMLIFAASMFFYAWWDWRFLALILVVIVISFFVGILLADEKGRYYRSKLLVILHVVTLFAILGYFKYFNFFTDSFVTLAEWFGHTPSDMFKQIILPIGISFYTFQAIAYTVDIYRGGTACEKNFITFGAFISFFPQLIAGPIERASELLIQFQRHRTVTADAIKRGLALIILGYFFKVGIADVVSPVVNTGFDDEQISGWWTIFATYAFSIQIYGDFLGYSLIAKGVASLFGINLIWNFRRPYWSKSLVKFWQRWHISLSKWLRDYLYIPLGGNRGSRLFTIRNLIITMALGGLWHGASWLFILWGLLHGFALSINHLARGKFGNSRIFTTISVILVMIVVYVGWFLFRVESVEQAKTMIQAFDNWSWFPAHWALLRMLTVMTAIIFILEFFQEKYDDNLFFLKWAPWKYSLMFGVMIVYLTLISGSVETQFIYFQF